MSADVVPFLTEDALKERWYLTPAEITRLVPVSEWTVRRAIAEGELPATQLRRRWLIRTEDARRWIDEHGRRNGGA